MKKNSKDIVVKSEVVSVNDIKKEMTINSEDITRLVGHLDLVKQVVSETLKEGINGDYAVVPGTQKQALLKPGAEKLMKLFGLGVRFVESEKELDRYENFALYSYIAEVYHLRTGVVIASCEGTANSWEKKYKERTVYVKGIKSGTEPTPVCDILNTLKKMAQKRAMVGAVIIATGASDYFTQDEDEIENQQPIKKEVKKTDASRFTQGDQKNPGDFVAQGGKFKGIAIKDIEEKELTGYCKYVVENNPEINGPMKEFVDNAREFLRQKSA